MRKVKAAIAILLLGLWAYGSWILWISSQLMSLDEDWEGWGEVLLNPYIVTAYVVASVALLVPVYVLVRDAVSPRVECRSDAMKRRRPRPR